MENYKVLIKKSAVKELENLQLHDRRRVAAKIGGLAEAPRPPGREKLSGQERYRLRQGDYRIVYSVDDTGRVVDVVKVGHRREVYR